MTDNLVRQKGGSGYHVRLAIPKDVQHAFGNRTVLSKSLGTTNRTDAMRLRLPYLTRWKDQIEAARCAKANRGDAWKEDAQAYAATISTCARTYVNAVANHDPDPTLEEPVSPIAQNYFNTLMEDPDYKAALQELWEHRQADGLGGEIEFTHDLRRIVGSHFQQAIAAKNSLSPDEEEELASIFEDPSSYKPKSPISKGMLEEWTTHLKTQIDNIKTIDMHRNRMQRISQFLSSEGLVLNFDSIHKFLESTDGARQTRKNYLWSGNSFWRWANRYNPKFREQFSKEPNPFKEHTHPTVGEKAGQSYVAFEREEIEYLHARALEKNDSELANLIAIAAYTGARLEEIGRIRPEDITTDNSGAPAGFKITKAKSKAGIREVPLHPDIAPLFIKLIEQAPENDGYLFKGGKNKYGNRLDALGKRFGRLKDQKFSELHVFHSIRHTVVTRFHQLGIGIEVLPWIIGHEVEKSFTLKTYSTGASFEQKREWICRLEYSFTLPA